MEAASSTGVDILGGTDFLGQFQFTVDFFVQVGTDFFAFIVVAGFVAAFAFYFGRDRLMAFIAGLYAAIVLYRAFPYGSFLPQDNPYVQIGVFVGFFLAALVAFSGLSAFLARQTSGIFGTLVLSAVTAGLILAIAIHILPVQSLYTFSAPTLALFASAEMFFWWLLAPLAGLFFFGR